MFVNKLKTNGSFLLWTESSVNFQKLPFVNGTLPSPIGVQVFFVHWRSGLQFLGCPLWLEFTFSLLFTGVRVYSFFVVHWCSGSQFRFCPFVLGFAVYLLSHGARVYSSFVVHEWTGLTFFVVKWCWVVVISLLFTNERVYSSFVVMINPACRVDYLHRGGKNRENPQKNSNKIHKNHK